MNNIDQYYEKYIYYKNIYLKIKNKYNQFGAGQPAVKNIVKYNFSDLIMDEYFNPIYGLYMCESGSILNILLIYKEYIEDDLNYTQQELLNNLFMNNNIECIKRISLLFRIRSDKVRLYNCYENIDVELLAMFIAILYLYYIEKKEYTLFSEQFD